jgi:CIC family chloride channel protein
MTGPGEQPPVEVRPGRVQRALAPLLTWVFRLRVLIRTGLDRLLPRLKRGEHVFAIVTAMGIGVLGGYGAIAFRTLISLTHRVFFTTSEYSLDFLQALPWWQRLAMPSVGGLAVGLIVTRLAPEVKGSGIPEVMEAVARRGGAIRVRVLLTKALAAALTIGSGGSAGREGPIVHIGSAIGSAVGQLLEVSARRLRTFVACGAAAAIAATFNAPIAGALFAIEIVLGDLAVGSLSPIVISSVVATVISRHHLGDFPAFVVPAYESRHPFELLLYAALGLLAGLAAAGFIRLLYGIGDGFDRAAVPPWLKPAIGGLAVGVISLWLPHVYGVGYETINAALWGRASGLLLLVLVLGKAIATSLTLGSGGSGGIFAPSLFMGATLGAMWGHVVHDLFPQWTAAPGAYALVGMGAMVSATTHAPITAILVIFELTNDYRIIPPLMVACVIGILVSGLLHRESVYTAKLARRGVRLAHGKDVNLLRSIRVHEVMDTEPPTVPAALPFAELVPRLLAGQHTGLFVVDDDGLLVGAVSLNDVRAVLPDSELLATLAVAADAVNADIPYVLPGDHLDLVMHLFGRTHRDELPVCASAEDRRVVGAVTRDAIIDEYNRRIFHLDLPGGFGSLVEAVREGRMIEVVGGILLAEVEIPYRLVGRTLAETDLRRTYGVEVVLIHTPDATGSVLEGRPGKLPAPGIRLEAGDRLLVMGTRDAIASLQGDG